MKTTKTIFDTVRYYNGLIESIIENLRKDNEHLTKHELENVAYSITNDLYQEYLNEEINLIQDGLNEFIKRYEKRYNTKIDTLLFTGTRSSHYGYIGGAGAELGGTAEDITDLLQQLTHDDFTINIEDNKLQIATYDHDGTNYLNMVLITENESDKAYNSDLDIRDMFRYKKHTTLDKQFKEAFGA